MALRPSERAGRKATGLSPRKGGIRQQGCQANAAPLVLDFVGVQKSLGRCYRERSIKKHRQVLPVLSGPITLSPPLLLGPRFSFSPAPMRNVRLS